VERGVCYDWLVKRITEIEGLRGYLALWVLCSHVLGNAGFAPQDYGWFFHLFRLGQYAVDIFMLVSGFVIFYLLDSKVENYSVFLVRRVFRIWPLATFIFFVAVALSPIWLAVAVEAGNYGKETRILSWWHYFWAHTAAHITLMHGVFPESILPDSPEAFTSPPWSVSLEWQFYLVAPILFHALNHNSKFVKGLGVLAVGVTWAVAPFLPSVRLGAFLPMHIEFFFWGAVSFFIYKKILIFNKEVLVLPFAAAGAVLLMFANNWKHDYFPISIWIFFIGLLIDSSGKESIKTVTRIFTNPWSQFLGKISYSLYLCHILIMEMVSATLTAFAPTITGWTKVYVLFPTTLALSIAASIRLYAWIERPGIRLGSKLANKLTKYQAEDQGLSFTELEIHSSSTPTK
jgi:peptidoglycan/LPS O-acetylase OafA/YrhL